jgi:predicted RNase H-like nuclease (RuvC/YqgF family)
LLDHRRNCKSGVFLRKTIQSLEEENRKLQGEIDSQKSRRSSVTEERNLRKILELVDQCIFLEKEVKDQSKISDAMGKQLSLAETRLDKLKARVELAQDSGRRKNDVTNEEIEAKEFAAKKKLETV